MKPNDDEHVTESIKPEVLAQDCGYEMIQDGSHIRFHNRGLMIYRHLSWFFGVFAGIMILFLAVVVYMWHSGQAKKDADIQLLIGINLFLFSAVPTMIFILKWRQRKNMKPGFAPIIYTTDLSRGMLKGAKGKVLCSLTDLTIQRKSAWDNYLTGDQDFFENIVLEWGAFQKAIVFKTGSNTTAADVIDHLNFRFFQKGEDPVARLEAFLDAGED